MTPQQPRPPATLGRRRAAAVLVCAAATAPRLARAEGGVTSTLALRDLYDGPGDAPSDAARRLLGRRVTLRGVVQPAPAPLDGWYALSEAWVAPCQLCGLAHDWPVGVVAAEVADLPPLPGPAPRAALSGVLAESGAVAAGLPPGRLALRDARLVLA